MPFELSHDRRGITDQDLLTDLRRVAEEQSEQGVKQRTYKQIGKYGVTTIIRRSAPGMARSKRRGSPRPLCGTCLMKNFLPACTTCGLA